MQTLPSIRPGLRRLITVNACLQPGEGTVVVTDSAMEAIAGALMEELRALGFPASIRRIERREQDGQEPDAATAVAMREADVIFSAVSISITHTRAMRAALEQGARAVLMTAHNERVLTCPALLETDFVAQVSLCQQVGAALGKGKIARLTSARGTDLRIPITARPVNILTGIPGPGELAPVPTIEVNVVPVHGAAEGILVADGSIPYLGIGVLEEPVVCTIRNGYVTAIEGGAQARRFEKALASHGDRECYHVAELGIGLNPHAALTGYMLEDEGVFGSIHIGLGTSYTLGGEIVAPTHYDLVMLDARLEVDGEMVMAERRIVL